MGAGATKAFGRKKTSAALVQTISGHSPLTSVTIAKKSLEVARDVLPHLAYTDGKFTGAPMPDNEPERIGYLCALNVLDTPPDPKFDSITSLACLMFKVPIALVSLVDNDRQWFKSVQGLSTDHTDRKSSFCAWTLLPEHPEVLVVPDATQDVRFVNNPLVTGPPDIRFYAGSPLVCSNGMRMGSLCIIDRIPRVFSADECMMLANLSEMVVRELEKEKLLADQKAMSVALEQENTQLLRAIDAFSEGIMLCNVTKSQWPVEFINDAFEQLTGFTKADLGNGFWSFFKIAAPDISAVQAQYRRAIEERDAFELTVYFTDGLKQKRFLTMQMRCANLDSLNEMTAVGIPSSLQDTAAQGEGISTYYFATLSPGQMSDGLISPASSRLSSASGGVAGGNAFLLLDNHNNNPCDDVKLGQLLGRGSYGRVYRGRWNGAQVAVKILDWVDSKEEGEGGGKEMMEALLSTQLSHPNVVQTFKHFGREVGRNSEDNAMMETWMVMDFCNKGGLTDAIDRGDFRKRGAMFECDFRSFLTTAREIASAMCYLHSCRIIHGDLTANNILLASSEKDQRGFLVKVCDFGLSRVIEGKESLRTRTMGTVTHMPPELINEGTVSQAADTYAFGVILWEMYVGERPWRGLNHSQIISAISSGKQLQLGGNCPAMLRKFITKCMSTKPTERPTFVQVLKELEDLEDDLVGTTGES